MENARALRRQRVMIGDLPDDFLRVSSKSGNNVNNQSAQRSHALPFPANSFYPSGSIGNLAVTVVQAELVKNYGITKMDPYVKLWIDHNMFETHANLRGGKHPQWNKTFQSLLSYRIKKIYIEVFDERAITPDERIAWVNIPVPDELFDKQYIENWYPLSGRQGEEKEGKIKLIMAFMPIQVQPCSVPSASAPLMVVPTPFYSGLPYYSTGYPVPVHYPADRQQWPLNPAYVQMQQQSLPPSEHDIKQLQEMFSSFDKDVIVSVLESTRGNKDQAINILLSITTDK